MRVVSILFNYFLWHYTEAFGSIFSLYRTFFQFALFFFSLPLMFRTWLAPWRRLDETYQGNIFNASQWAEALVVNTLMRIVGFLIRSLIILAGLSALVLLALSLPLLFLAWLVLPLGVVVLFLVGFGLLFIK